MRFFPALAVVSVATVLAGAPAPLAGQDLGPNPRLTVRPLVFFSNTDGVLDFPQTGERLLMADSVLSLDWSFQGELRLGSFALLFDAAMSRTANDAAWLPDTTRGGTYDFRVFTAEAFAGLRVGPLSERIEVIAFAGARYYDFRHDLAGMGPAGQRHDRWVGPTVGIRTTVGFTRTLRWWAQPDFGVRIGRQVIVWGLRSGLDFHIVGPVGVTLQYKYHEIDYQIQPDETFNFQGTTQGWLVGLVLNR